MSEVPFKGALLTGAALKTQLDAWENACPRRGNAFVFEGKECSKNTVCSLLIFKQTYCWKFQSDDTFFQFRLSTIYNQFTETRAWKESNLLLERYGTRRGGGDP